jgi:(p)ppGpp synthase/HD superfamily hydrolase
MAISIVPMGMCAQTSIQLFNQLQRDGYQAGQLRMIADAYFLAMRLFAGRVEVSGKSFLGHVTGTASILSAISAPAELVAAGLLHNVYCNGDFGDYSRKITPGRRKRIRNAIGETAEQYVYKFASRRWNAAGLRQTRAQLQDMPELDRHVVLLYVAEQLEKHLDLEILYRGDYEQRCRHYRQNGPLLVDMAQQLGYPGLSRQLQEAIEKTLGSTIPGELRSRDDHRFSYLSIPESCRRKRMVPALLALPRRIRRLLRKHRGTSSMAALQKAE